MSLKLNSSGGGSITLQEPSTASNRTLTLPDNTGTVISTASTSVISQAMLAAGVAGNGPAFLAWAGAATSVSNTTWTKVGLNSETFDTNNNFDTATSRFTPTVAGYYYFSATVQCVLSSSACCVSIYKNGGSQTFVVGGWQSGGFNTTTCSSIVLYMNGTTDYVEVYVYQASGGTVNTANFSNVTNFSGALVRAA